MTRSRVLSTTAAILLTVSIACSPSVAGGTDNRVAPAKGAVITALNPTTGTIEVLKTLREKGLLPSDGLTVLGVYHATQLADFEASHKLIAAEGLDWITLHAVTAPLDEGSLFGRNGCSDELEVIFARSDGILFFGGADIPPSVYGEKTRLVTGISTPYRHHFESTFAFHLLGGSQDEEFQGFLERDLRFPVVGFCLGAQTLNVGTGGTLVQDIPSEVYGLDTYEDVLELPREAWHRNPNYFLFPGDKPAPFFMHRIELLEGGRITTEMGVDLTSNPLVYSSHHQAVEKPGKGIKVIGTSLDGKVVEVIEHERFPNVLGVQFHPESWRVWTPAYEALFVPGEPLVGIQAMVAGDPASLDLHRKLWAWIVARVLEHHAARQ